MLKTEAIELTLPKLHKGKNMPTALSISLCFLGVVAIVASVVITGSLAIGLLLIRDFNQTLSIFHGGEALEKIDSERNLAIASALSSVSASSQLPKHNLVLLSKNLTA